MVLIVMFNYTQLASQKKSSQTTHLKLLKGTELISFLNFLVLMGWAGSMDTPTKVPLRPESKAFWFILSQTIISLTKFMEKSNNILNIKWKKIRSNMTYFFL